MVYKYCKTENCFHLIVNNSGIELVLSKKSYLEISHVNTKHRCSKEAFETPIRSQSSSIHFVVEVFISLRLREKKINFHSFIHSWLEQLTFNSLITSWFILSNVCYSDPHCIFYCSGQCQSKQKLRSMHFLGSSLERQN